MQDSAVQPLAPNTIASIETLRGIICLFGIVLHACMFYAVLALDHPIAWHSMNGHQAVFLTMLNWIHMFRMPEFFFLAGFFCYRTYHARGSVALMKKRIVRLGLPLLIIQLAPFAFYALLPYVNSNPAFHAPLYWHEVNEKLLNVGAYWFLEYLLILYVANICMLKLLKSALPTTAYATLKHWMTQLLATPWSFVTITVSAGLLMFFTKWWFTPSNFQLLPNMPELLIYEIFFVMGWLIYKEVRLLAWVQTHGVKLSLVATFVICPIYVLTSSVWAGHDTLRLFLSDMLYASGSWIMMLGLLGLCLRYLCHRHAITRYLADASYWVYLVQIPIIGFFYSFLQYLKMNTWFSFVVTNVLTLAICLLSYQIFIRGRSWLFFLDSQYRPKKSKV